MNQEKQLPESLVKAGFTFEPNNIPKEMKKFKQWVIWTLVKEPGKDKPSKLPIKIVRKGSKISFVKVKWSDPQNQMSFDEAVAEYENNKDMVSGVGFVFTNDDPFVFIDLDNIYPTDASKGENQNAYNYIDMAAGTFIEFSQSNKGVHIIVEGYINKSQVTSAVEMYKNGRFVAMTGKLTPKGESKVVYNQKLIDRVLSDLDIDAGLEADQHSKFEIPEIIEVGERNDTLYRAAWQLYGKGLRDEEFREEYFRIVERCEVPIPSNDSAWQFPERVEEEYEILQRRKERSAENVGLSEKYAYIPDINKYFDFDTKQVYVSEALNRLHASTHTGRDGILRASAYIDTSPKRKVCHGIIWMPAKYGEYSETISHEGLTFANTWNGFAVNPVKGDISPWMKVLDHLYPNEKERNNVIRRMAFDVQYPDRKCSWHIVNFGIQGAGKDLALYPLSRIFGSSFGTVGNQEIRSDYDDGFIKKKIVEVNEVNGLSNNSLEKIKQKCTDEGSKWMQLNPKKEAKITVPNLWSLYFNTNHSDAMHITSAERRFYVLRCDTAMVDRFTAKEIDYIAEWIKRDQFSANYVMHYLMNVDLTGFDPGIVPEKTKAFYDMCEIVKSDLDDTLDDWQEQRLHAFRYEFLTPDLIMRDLSLHGVRVPKSPIKVWLQRNNWRQLGLNKRPQKAGEKAKSITYYYRDNRFDSYSAADLWDVVDREERDRDEIGLEL